MIMIISMIRKTYTYIKYTQHAHSSHILIFFFLISNTQLHLNPAMSLISPMIIVSSMYLLSDVRGVVSDTSNITYNSKKMIILYTKVNFRKY